MAAAAAAAAKKQAAGSCRTQHTAVEGWAGQLLAAAAVLSSSLQPRRVSKTQPPPVHALPPVFVKSVREGQLVRVYHTAANHLLHTRLLYFIYIHEHAQCVQVHDTWYLQTPITSKEIIMACADLKQDMRIFEADSSPHMHVLSSTQWPTFSAWAARSSDSRSTAASATVTFGRLYKGIKSAFFALQEDTKWSWFISKNKCVTSELHQRPCTA